jgi:hypothetical protein
MKIDQSDNLAYGTYALERLTSDGQNNIAIGLAAGRAITGADRNVLIGVTAGRNLDSNSRNDNTFIGHRAGFGAAATTSTFIGSQVGPQSGSGNLVSNNIFIGFNTGDIRLTSQASEDNILIGNNIMPDHTTISNQVDRNVMIGNNIALVITGGDDNVIIGADSSPAITTGRQNVIIGTASCDDLTVGVENVVIGDQAAILLSTGDFNTIVGKTAAGTLTTGNNNIVIGANADVPAADATGGIYFPTEAAGMVISPTGVASAGDTYVSYQSTTGQLRLSQGPRFFRGSVTFVDGSVPAARTILHLLGRIPDIYRAKLVCILAIANYAVGDEILLTTSSDPGSSSMTISANSTNISFSYSTGALTLANRTTAATFVPVSTNWNMFLEGILL